MCVYERRLLCVQARRDLVDSRHSQRGLHHIRGGRAAQRRGDGAASAGARHSYSRPPPPHTPFAWPCSAQPTTFCTRAATLCIQPSPATLCIHPALCNPRWPSGSCSAWLTTSPSRSARAGSRPTSTCRGAGTQVRKVVSRTPLKHATQIRDELCPTLTYVLTCLLTVGQRRRGRAIPPATRHRECGRDERRARAARHDASRAWSSHRLGASWSGG